MIIVKQFNPLILSFALSTMLVLAGCTTDETGEKEQDFQYKVQLKSFDSCDQLAGYLQDTVIQERKLMDYYYDELFPERVFNVDLQFDAAVNNNSGSLATAESSDTIGDHTSTNNQVAGGYSGHSDHRFWFYPIT